MKYTTLPQMFFDVCERFKNETALMEKVGDDYTSISYNEYLEKVLYLSSALISLDVKKGDKISIYSDNCIKWAITDFATVTVGGITVTIFPTLPSSQAKYILFHSESKIVFVGRKNQLEKVLGIKNELKHLEKIITFFDFEDSAFPEVISFKKLLKIGEEFYPKNNEVINQRVTELDSEDIASFIYTSGTTGPPKGAMLTHRNFVSNVTAAVKLFPIDYNDIFLSFLPLSHVFERTAGHFLPVYIGATIAYSEKPEKVADNLPEVRPTVMVSVPRLYEKMHQKIIDKVEKSNLLKKKIFYWSLNTGKKFREAKEKGKISKLLSTRFNIADKLLFSKLRDKVGGRLRFFISGGAALPPEINEFFQNAGLDIYQGYGLTETSPVVSVNRIEKNKIGTVGLPIEGVDIKISDDGEILVKGDNVMKGYYKDEIATQECIDSDGWFHTGDIGFIDEEGFLTITDRKKNIIVLDNGKNIAPQPIEFLLLSSKYIDQILLFGDKRKYISALIVPNFDYLTDYAKKYNIHFSTKDDLVNNDQIKTLFKNEINTYSYDLASYEKIKRFTLMNGEFTIENGEMTPSLKLKRGAIEKKYKDIIEKMYH